MDCSTPGSPVLYYLLAFAQTPVHWLMIPSNHLILCHPPLLLPSIFPSISVFSNELALRIRWPKYWASASVLPMNVHGWFPLGLAGLIPLQSKGLSIGFCSTTVRKHQFVKSINDEIKKLLVILNSIIFCFPRLTDWKLLSLTLFFYFLSVPLQARWRLHLFI